MICKAPKGVVRELSQVQKEILRLKEEKNAIILAHNYVASDIQEIADYVGDSLGLSRQAKETTADVIVFAGVDFMAETAKILNPDKTVLIPDRSAGCSLSELCDARELQALKDKHPNAVVISYINCSSEVKMISDIICTSGNALDIVKQIPEDKEIIFCPDMHLGSWIIEQTGRDMILWQGYCYAHTQYEAESLLALKAKYPNAPLMTHPECPKPVRDISDIVCSTEKMIAYARNHESDVIIMGTVMEMVYRLMRDVPEKTFVVAGTPTENCLQCKHMIKNTPEKLLACLENMSGEILLDKEVIEKASASIENMLKMSK